MHVPYVLATAHGIEETWQPHKNHMASEALTEYCSSQVFYLVNMNCCSETCANNCASTVKESQNFSGQAMLTSDGHSWIAS